MDAVRCSSGFRAKDEFCLLGVLLRLRRLRPATRRLDRALEGRSRGGEEELRIGNLEWRWKTAALPALQKTVAKAAAGIAGQVAWSDASDSRVSFPPRPRLADYAARYSLLGPVEQLPTDLIVNEYYARHRCGGRPTTPGSWRRCFEAPPTSRTSRFHWSDNRNERRKPP